jgi:hypothetical protein
VIEQPRAHDAAADDDDARMRLHVIVTACLSMVGGSRTVVRLRHS